jgi:hypothetical protein
LSINCRLLLQFLELSFCFCLAQFGQLLELLGKFVSLASVSVPLRHHLSSAWCQLGCGELTSVNFRSSSAIRLLSDDPFEFDFELGLVFDVPAASAPYVLQCQLGRPG